VHESAGRGCESEPRIRKGRDSVEIKNYLQIVNRRKWVLILTPLVTAVVVGLGTRMQQPTYAATTTVRVAQASSGSIDYVDYMYAERLMNTYINILKSRPVLEEVAKRLDLAIAPEALVAQVKAETILDTELLKISVEDTDPERAKGIAETLAALLVEQSQSLYFGGARSAREILQDQLTLVEDNLEADRATLQTLLSSSEPDDKKIEAQRVKIGLGEEIYASLLKQYEQARVSEAARANSVTIIEPAVLPYAPSKPRTKLNLMLGTLIGVIGGLGLALLFENLDPVLHSEDDLASLTKVPMLGSIPRFATRGKQRPETLAIRSTGQSSVGEAYRALRGNILSLDSDAPLKTLLIAGAEPGAGKSTVLVNLAAALAEAGRRVVIVDGDLRRPSLHQALHLSNERGLSSILLGQTPVDAALQQAGIGGVQALTAGPPPDNAAVLLGSPKMQEIIQTLAQTADVVLMDSPPIALFADAAALATVVDGVLLVVAQDQATATGVQKALRQMDHVKAKSLGIVFNKAKAQRGNYYY